MKRSGFSQKNRKPLKRSAFKCRNSVIKPKTAIKLKKSTKPKKDSIGKLQRTCDALMQQTGKLKYPTSLISGLPTQVMHHYIPKSVSSILRYDWDNLIPLTNGEHCRLHQSPDPTTNTRILQKKGMEWFEELKRKSTQINKVNRDYYEGVKEMLLEELKSSIM
jgi:hypothetical protein